MAEVKWIKVATDMFDANRKIKQIEQMPEGDAILVIWLKLMLLAGQINDRGAVYVTPEIPYTEEMLATELRKPLATVKIALAVFRRFGMITTENGVICLPSWEKHQNTDRLTEIREYNRIAKQKYRAKQKSLKADVPDMSLTCQRGHDTEIEEEIELEEENHSIKHSDVLGSCLNEKGMDSAERDSVKRRFLGGSLGKGVVLLSDAQMESLLDVLSAEEFDHYVSVVAQNELKGHKYTRKTHYDAIMDMAQRDRRVR